MCFIEAIASLCFSKIRRDELYLPLYFPDNMQYSQTELWIYRKTSRQVCNDHRMRTYLRACKARCSELLPSLCHVLVFPCLSSVWTWKALSPFHLGFALWGFHWPRLLCSIEYPHFTILPLPLRRWPLSSSPLRCDLLAPPPPLRPLSPSPLRWPLIPSPFTDLSLHLLLTFTWGYSFSFICRVFTLILRLLSPKLLRDIWQTSGRCELPFGIVVHIVGTVGPTV